MGEKRQRRHIPSKYKRGIVAASIILALVLLAYAGIVRPDQDAKSYIHHLDDSSKPVQQCFDKLAQTTELGVFYAPDIALERKQTDVTTILHQIDHCRRILNQFEQESRQLMRVPIGSLTTSYQQAKVYQRQTFDIIGQSNDVLDQYRTMASFLSDYYGHIAVFTAYTSQTQATQRQYVTSAQLRVMEQQANDLRVRAKHIRTLDAPREFTTTKLETATMFTSMASGLDNVVNGIRNGQTEVLETGYQQTELAAASYDSTIINLPFSQLTKSYIPAQVSQLPVKIKNLLTTSSE